MRLWQRLFLVLCAVLSGGCATVANSAHTVTFTTFGDADTINKRQKDVLERFKALREHPPADKIAGVKVLQNALPDGVEVKDGTISVKDGYPHVVLGKFTLSPSFASTFWFADYDPTWRKGYCYWQVPLTWVTLGLWQALVPISYPCAGGKLMHDVAIEQVKTLAVVVGANLVVLEIKENEEVVGSASGLLIHTELGSINPGKQPPAKGAPSTASAEPLRAPRAPAKAATAGAPVLAIDLTLASAPE
jgi:hypothetical protein